MLGHRSDCLDIERFSDRYRLREEDSQKHRDIPIRMDSSIPYHTAHFRARCIISAAGYAKHLPEKDEPLRLGSQ